jgi:hypothetical protein
MMIVKGGVRHGTFHMIGERFRRPEREPPGRPSRLIVPAHEGPTPPGGVDA